MAYVSILLVTILDSPLIILFLSSLQLISVALFLAQTSTAVKWEGKVLHLLCFSSILLSHSSPRKDPRCHSSCISIRGRITNNRFISIWSNSSPMAMWKLIWRNRHRSTLLVIDYFFISCWGLLYILPFCWDPFSDGVRAGAKRLGRKKQLTDAQKELMLQHRLSPSNPCVIPISFFVFFGFVTHCQNLNSGNYSDDQPYIPPTKPYELSQLVTDLVLFARYLLKPGGRLVFFLPTVTDEYEEIDIHTMLCEGMEVIANSLQDFGSWGRRVSCLSFLSSSICLYSGFDL